MNINSIDDYIKIVYPDPDETDPDYGFFKAWGHEQYLIKKLKHNYEQLRILLANDYNMFRLAKFLKGDNIEESLKNKKLVKAKKILTGFLMTSVGKGWYGILLWEENGGYFCVFPKHTNVFPNLMRLFNLDEIEITEDVFTTEQVLFSKIDEDSFCYPYQLQNHICYIPAIGNVYIKIANSGYANSEVMIQCVKAEQNEKGKWVYPKTKKNLEFKYFPFQQLSDCKILEW